MNAGATAPEWGGALLDWGIDTDATFTSTPTAAWQDVGSSVTLTLPVPGVVIAIGSGRFYSSGSWNAFLSVNIDGTNGQSNQSAAASIMHTPVFIKACAAGNIACKLQSYAYSTDTSTVVNSQLIAFAFAGS